MQGLPKLQRHCLAPFPCPAKSRCMHRRTDAHARVHQGQAVTVHHTIDVETVTGCSVVDITTPIQDFLTASVPGGSGMLAIASLHTTTAVTVNEYELRLVEDLRLWLSRQAPASDMYLHNDIDQRFPPDNWGGSVEEWRAQEPINAHGHLLSMLLGNSEAVPVAAGRLQLGTWQSVLLVDLDGPRARTVSLTFTGVQQPPE